MDLNLRKARKLEAKIGKHIADMELNENIKLRVFSTAEERGVIFEENRTAFFNRVSLRNDLVSVRFLIRNLIASANHSVGVNDLMNAKEGLQTRLTHATALAVLNVVELVEAEDAANARKRKIESGNDNSYDNSVTVQVSLLNKEDLNSYKDVVAVYSRALEDVEDQLSQKNLGAKIELDENTVSLLKSVGLV